MLGIGGVRDIFFGVRCGIDTFDCVHPTRIGRHGAALVKASFWDDINSSVSIDNRKSKKWEDDRIDVDNNEWTQPIGSEQTANGGEWIVDKEALSKVDQIIANVTAKIWKADSEQVFLFNSLSAAEPINNQMGSLFSDKERNKLFKSLQKLQKTRDTLLGDDCVHAPAASSSSPSSMNLCHNDSNKSKTVNSLNSRVREHVSLVSVQINPSIDPSVADNYMCFR